MYSKVKFDIDEDNMPCIVAEIAANGLPTDDVRDKIARRFTDPFQFETNLCYVEFDENRLIIRPISPENLKAFKESNTLIYHPHMLCLG